MRVAAFHRGLRAQKAPLGFEPRISCLLDRRFNQLSHGAAIRAQRRHHLTAAAAAVGEKVAKTG